MRTQDITRPNYPARRWFGARLERMRVAYEKADRLQPLAVEFGTSRGGIVRLAKLHGWQRKAA